MKARHPRLALATVIGEGFLGRLAFGMLSFAFPLYAYSLGLSLTQIGILISIRSVAVLPFKPVAGWLADRIGIRAVYLGGSFARTLAAAWLLFAGDFISLVLVRILQGASAAGRDVASLGVVVRDAQHYVASAYSWYSSAKHVGGVGGAALAGIVIAASGGTYRNVLMLVLALSILPLIAAYFGLRELPDDADKEQETKAAQEMTPQGLASTWALLREIAGPAFVGALVAASAYMVHGIFPVLATEYAGLNAGQAGVIYSLSAVVFLLTEPFVGWLSDRHGRVPGLAWRSAANIGSSILYMVSPSFAGIAAARCIDDPGKAAFRPAWASAIAQIAGKDKLQSGRRIGALDTATTVGEVIGPALAGFLWQTGGIVPLFAVRIAIAVVAEVTALRVFGEISLRFRPSARLTALAYLLPVTFACVGLILWQVLGSASSVEQRLIDNVWSSTGILSIGLLMSGLIGTTAAHAEKRAKATQHDEEQSRLRHDIRRSLTVIQGEVELILSQNDIPADERQTSSQSILEEVEQMTRLLEETMHTTKPKVSITSGQRDSEASPVQSAT